MEKGTDRSHAPRWTGLHTSITAGAQGLIYEDRSAIQPFLGHLHPRQLIAVLHSIQGENFQTLLWADLRTFVAQGAALGFDEGVEPALVATSGLQLGLFLGVAQLYLIIQVQPLLGLRPAPAFF